VVQLVITVLLHVPAEQTSAVPELPSLQCALIVQQPGVGVYVPPHEPAPQASGVVQAFPSLQDAVLFACAQPVGLAHESSVQALPSSQLGAEPGWHAWLEHVSSPLQGLPSAQSAARLQQAGTASCWHTVLTHVSVVQTLPSSQSALTEQLEVVKLRMTLVVVAVASETSTFHS
jgi:hypothetical protein